MERRTRNALLLNAAGLLFCLGAMLLLGFLLWKYVPRYAELFAALGVELPLLTRIVILTSNWFVRLLPFLVLAMSAVVPLFAIGALVLGPRSQKAPVIIAAFLFALAVLAMGGCAVVLYAMQLPAADLAQSIR